MTTTFHLTRYDYTLGWVGPVVAHAPDTDRAFTQGSTWQRGFVFSGDRTGSEWSAVINDKWADNDETNGVLATAACTADYDAETDKTTVTVIFDGDDISFAVTENVTTAKQRAKAIEGVNYYVWELLEVPTNGLPWKPFTGYVEVHPGAV